MSSVITFQMQQIVANGYTVATAINFVLLWNEVCLVKVTTCK